MSLRAAQLSFMVNCPLASGFLYFFDAVSLSPQRG